MLTTRNDSRTVCQVAAVAACLTAVAVQAATNTASLHLYCQSVRVEMGSASSLGQTYFSEFSSYGNWSQPNAEFHTLLEEEPPTHFSFFLLSGDLFHGLMELEGLIWITVPETVDANGDGIPDFYQVAEGIQATADGGRYVIPNPMNPQSSLDHGTVEATWQRAPGAHRGVCDLVLAGQGPIDTRIIPAAGLRFTHEFEIIEYAGTYRYLPAIERIDGSMEVARVGRAEQTLRGPMPMIRASFNPFEALDLLPARWTNQLGQTLEMLGGYLDLYPEFELQYYGPLSFEDGDLTTDDLDYEFYYAAIGDPNDHDGDGIPDLTDPPAAPAPALGLTLANDAPVLTITGEAGQTFLLQNQSTLTPAGWRDVQTITLAGATQSVTLPLPDSQTSYWRLVSPP